MLSAVTAAIIRATEGRGAPGMLEIGRNRRLMVPVSLRQSAMRSVAGARTLPKGVIGIILSPNVAGQPCYLGNVG
jgi:hypothetical protein